MGEFTGKKDRTKSGRQDEMHKNTPDRHFLNSSIFTTATQTEGGNKKGCESERKGVDLHI